MSRPAAMPPPAQSEREHHSLSETSLARLFEESEERIAEGVPRLTTGISLLDRALGGGWVIPSFVAIGAGPKSLKSTTLQVNAKAVVEAGGYVLHFDLENGRLRILRQLACRHSQVGPDQLSAAMRAVRARTASDEDRRIDAAFASVRGTLGRNWFLEDRLEGNREQAQAHVTQRLTELRRAVGDEALILLVIDSLQKLPGELSDRRAMVDLWVRFFEGLIKDDTRLVIVAASEIAQDPNGNYTGDFKESRGIEYGAHTAIKLIRRKRNSPVEVLIRWARDSDSDVSDLVVGKLLPQFPFYGLKEEELSHRSGGSAPETRKKPGPLAAKRSAAEDFLRDFLEERGQTPSREAINAGEKAGHHRGTLYSAANALKIDKSGGVWRLP